MWLQMPVLVLAVMVTTGSLAKSQSVESCQFAQVLCQVRLEQLLSRWDQEARRVQSLVVEFTFERKSPVFPSVPAEEFTGRFEWRRFPGGRVEGSYELRPKDPNVHDQKSLLIDEHIYLFRPEEKVILVLPMAKGTTFDFLAELFLPEIRLLEKKEARFRYQPKITKMNEWYSYIEARIEVPELFFRRISYRRVAVLNESTVDIPPDMPRQIFWLEPNGSQCKYDIHKWQMDTEINKDREPMHKPELPEGWQFVDILIKHPAGK
jgi:hypothetical protein